MIRNKTIVLTGASSGIGLEVLRLFMKDPGNTILAVSRRAEERLAGFPDNVIPFNMDVSSAEGVDAIFKKADEVFEGKKIDIFYANAGFPYYEEFNYTDWDRVKAMFDTNTLSPIYTYSASKFGLQGFQEAIRLEKPKNLQLTCLYPIATDTNFFNVANPVPFEKPFPVQKPEVVARKMVEGIEQGKPFVSPSPLFAFAKVLMGVCPPVRTVYWALETAKLERFKNKLREMNK